MFKRFFDVVLAFMLSWKHRIDDTERVGESSDKQ